MEMKLRQLVLKTSIFSVVIAGLAASPAFAKPVAVGTYKGTTADGSGVTFVVTKDADTGVFAVTSATIFYTAVCPGNAGTVGQGIGFGLSAAIHDKMVTYSSNLPNYFYEQFALTFDTTDNTVTGTVTSATAQLAKRNGIPTRAYECISASQALTASLVTPAITPAAKAPAASSVVRIYQ